MHTLQLDEWQATRLPATALTESAALAIAETKLVDVEFPSPRNKREYVLRSRTTVGLVRISRELMLRIVPKVPVGNLFGMLEAVHELRSLRFYSGIGHVEQIEDVYERLANMLALGVAQRIRRGLYSAYVEVDEEATVVRGRIDVARSLALQSRGSPAIQCSYQVQTVDIDDNRILLWTLDRIPRLGLPQGSTIARVYAARRALLGSVQLLEMHPRDCENRSYNRLNADYEQLHALARFFLERMGPGVVAGKEAFIPFTVNMATLFQEYVVACLRRHAPDGVTVSRQYRVRWGGDEVPRHFAIDIVLEDRRTGAVLAVIDAKYKRDEKPSSPDTQQAVAYAAHTDAPAAFLVYPFYLGSTHVMVGPTGRIGLTTLGLPLELDLATWGARFAGQVFSRVGPVAALNS